MTETKLSSYYRRVTLNVPQTGSRGRNGAFTATEVSVMTLPGPTPALRVLLVACSRRAADSPPLTLVLSPEDALLVAEELRQAAISTIPAETDEEKLVQEVLRAYDVS